MHKNTYITEAIYHSQQAIRSAINALYYAIQDMENEEMIAFCETLCDSHLQSEQLIAAVKDLRDTKEEKNEQQGEQQEEEHDVDDRR